MSDDDKSPEELKSQGGPIQGVDLSSDLPLSLSGRQPGSASGAKAINKANNVLDDSKARRHFRWLAMAAGSITLAALIFAMLRTVCSFVAHVESISGALEKLNPIAVTTTAATPAPAAGASGASSPKGASGPQKVASNPAEQLSEPDAAAKPPMAQTYLESSLKTIATSVVAITSILVIAITVLAIAFIRSTFTLTLPFESNSSKSDESPLEPQKPLEINLPGIEMLKAAGEALATVLKGLPGSGKT